MTGYRGNKIIAKILMRLVFVVLPLMLATGCAAFDMPDGRTPAVPAVKPPDERFEGLNEKQDPVTRVRVGRDILMPQLLKEDVWPDAVVGPFELHNETLASALQLILDEYDVSLAFEGNDALKNRVTVSNLHGKLKDVVHKVCAVADLYCHFEGGTLTVKKTETFVVDLPPINVVASAASAGGATSSSSSSSGTSSSQSSGSGTPPAGGASGGSAGASSGSSSSSSGGSAATTNDAYTQISTGLAAVLAMEDPSVTARPVIDTSTRVLIYSATQRSNKAAMQYFARLRKNTALIIFETHIWEVTLNNDSSTGINWSALTTFAKLGNFGLTSAIPDNFTSLTGAAGPITITPSYTGSKDLSASFILQFIADHGAVKTVSQPQITVLSGSQASLSVSQAENYVSGTATTGQGQVGIVPTTTLTTGTVTTGLNVNITSAWDQSTVYGAINITLNDLVGIATFSSPDGSSSVQLPNTTNRSIATEIRVRPGDSILIGGLVSQADTTSASGPGLVTPLFTTSRAASKANTELVFLLRPRVVVFDMGDDSDTPNIVDAPKDGMFPPKPPARRSSDKGHDPKTPDTTTTLSPVDKGTADKNTALPAGLSPDAFAPQDAPAATITATPVDPQGSALSQVQSQMAPVPIAPKPVMDNGGGVNR
jgi:hypothetical protein